MKIIRDITQANLPPVVATIGFFDGVHQGHRFLIEEVKNEAKKRGLPSMVVTFIEHPREVLQQDYVPSLLSLPQEKEVALATTGIDYCVPLHFTLDMAKYSAQKFMAKILKEYLHVNVLLIGYDHRFGHNRAEGFEDYQRYGEEMGMKVMKAPVFSEGEVRVSSSYVRKLLEEGDIEQVSQCLCRPYSIRGKVVKGYQIGRKMGFPTANIQVEDKRKLIPVEGVYVVLVKTNGHYFKGMLSIGNRPTFDALKEQAIEVHLLDVKEDFYEATFEVYFLKYLRHNVKFDKVEELICQMHEDEEKVRTFDFISYLPASYVLKDLKENL